MNKVRKPQFHNFNAGEVVVAFCVSATSKNRGSLPHDAVGNSVNHRRRESTCCLRCFFRYHFLLAFSYNIWRQAAHNRKGFGAIVGTSKLVLHNFHFLCDVTRWQQPVPRFNRLDFCKTDHLQRRTFPLYN